MIAPFTATHPITGHALTTVHGERVEPSYVVDDQLRRQAEHDARVMRLVALRSHHLAHGLGIRGIDAELLVCAEVRRAAGGCVIGC